MSKRSSQKHPGRGAQKMNTLTGECPDDRKEISPPPSPHEAARLDEASYICSQCGQTVHSYTKFTKHQEMHKSEEPCQCSECGMRFLNRTELSLHERMHASRAVYKCTVCVKRFIYKSHLIEHQKNHPNGKHELFGNKAPDMCKFQWSLKEKREIMYCYYYATALLSEGYMQLLRSKLEQRGVFPLAKLRCTSDAKLRGVIHQVQGKHYFTDANLELLKKAVNEELAGGSRPI